MRGVSVAALLLLTGASGVAQAATVPGEVVVGYRHGDGVQVLHRTDVRSAIAALRGRDDVRFAEPNYRYHVASVTPNDTFYPQQWAPPVMDLPHAWDYTTGSAAVRIAIVDTGIDLEHPDLAGNLWTNPGETPGDTIDNDNDGYVDDVHGYDFVDHDGNPDDPGPPPSDATVGHGTHVAGIAAAVGNNGQGVTGVAWSASLMAERACGTTGVCTTADQAAAIRLAVAKGARVVNLSIEGSPFSQAVDDAIHDAPGVLFVAAAGNGSANVDTTPAYPCAVPYANLICVASSDAGDGLSSFSNFGPATVDLAAPGGVSAGHAIFAPYPGGATYIERQGTSMAAPQVAGTAALLWSYQPAATVATVRDAILNSVDKAPALAGKVATGGRLNAFRALAALDTTPPDTTLGPAPASPTRSTSLSFTFTTNEINTGFECRIDAAAFAPCTSPHVVSGLADGNHEFAVRAVDPHPNPDPSPAIADFAVDTSGPVARFDAQPAAVAYATAARFAFHFDEPATDIACSLDGGGFAACQGRYETVVGAGSHTLQVRSTDALGNVGTTTATWTVDDTPPAVNLSPAVVDGQAATVSFTASEPAAFRCRLDDGATTDCASPVTFTGLAGGPHHATVTAIGTAGNASAPATVTWNVDTPQTLDAPAARPLSSALAAFVRKLAATPTRRVALVYRPLTAGTLVLSITAGADRIATRRIRVARAGTTTLDVRLPRSTRKAITRRGLKRLRFDVTFTPAGSSPPASAAARLRF